MTKLVHKKIGILLLIFLLIASVLWIRALLAPLKPDLSEYPLLPEFSSRDRVTIVAPHLDDETLGLGGLISRLQKQQIPVSVIFMTNGDDNPIGANIEFDTGYASPEQLIQSGKHRQDEALKATFSLGIPRNQIYFLGLPDRGLREMLSTKYKTTAYRSAGTLKTSSPYDNSYVRDLPYTGDSVRTALAKAINESNPTYVFTTAEQDRHSDHSATNQFVSQISDQIANSPKFAYFLIHYSKFPSPKGVGYKSPLLPPLKLDHLNWQVIPLTEEEVQAKKQAVEAYGSQLVIPFSGKVMRGFIRQNELLIVK